MPKDTLALQAEQRILIIRDQKVMLDFHLAELYDVETRALKQAVRHEKVILDSDLAELYGVATKVLNQAVQRNLGRFPDDFMFQLTESEAAGLRCQSGILNASPDSLRSQIVTLKRGQHRKYLPYAFTEQGVAMLSSVLHSHTSPTLNMLPCD